MSPAPAEWFAAGWFQDEWDELSADERQDWETRRRLLSQPLEVLQREQRHRDRQWTARREHARGARSRPAAPSFRMPVRQRSTRYSEVL